MPHGSMLYRWVPLTVAKYNDWIAEHGATFLIDRTSRHLEVWDVTPLDDAPGYVAVVTYYPPNYNASGVHADQRQELTPPVREELIEDISEVYMRATHFIMGYLEHES